MTLSSGNKLYFTSSIVKKAGNRTNQCQLVKKTIKATDPTSNGNNNRK